MEPKIQICIPVFNRRHNLELCFAALENQTNKDFVIAIGDDGSTDDLKTFIDKVNQTNTFVSPIKYIYCGHHQFYRQCRARNAAAKMAEDAITHFLFLDADVLLYPDVVELYYEAIRRNPHRAILGKYWWGKAMIIMPGNIINNWQAIIEERLPRLPSAPPHGMEGKDIREDNFVRTIPDAVHNSKYDGLSVFGGNYVISRELFWKVGGYDEYFTSPTEDGDFGLTLVEKGVPISYHNGINGYHVWHPRDIEEIVNRSKIDVEYINEKHKVILDDQNCSPDEILPAIEAGGGD